MEECQVDPCTVWNFDYESPPPPPSPVDDELVFDKLVSLLAAETTIDNYNEGSYHNKKQMISATRKKKKKKKKKKEMLLRLNYKAVITAWDCQASPWTTGIRPQIDPDDFCPDFSGVGYEQQPAGEGSGGSSNSHKNKKDDHDHDDGGREARVSRYREKRGRRLTLSKKIIRYHLRKLDAEKRPRLNGRFASMNSFMAKQINNDKNIA